MTEEEEGEDSSPNNNPTSSFPSIDTTPISNGRVSITPNLLNPTQVAALRADANALYLNGAFVPGGLRRTTNSKGNNESGDGTSTKTTTDETTRRCDVCGIFDDAEQAGPTVGDAEARENILLDLMADLRELLQRELGVELSEGMELQYLRYPGLDNDDDVSKEGVNVKKRTDDGGAIMSNKKNKRISSVGGGGGAGFYGRHFDSAANDENTRRRKISLLLYLNEDGWDAEKDGGILRAYVKPPQSKPQQQQPSSSAISTTASNEKKKRKRNRSGFNKEEGDSSTRIAQDVVPQGGKLVLFDSASVEHEVLPTCRERWAVVGWFLSADDDNEKKKKKKTSATMKRKRCRGNNNNGNGGGDDDEKKIPLLHHSHHGEGHTPHKQQQQQQPRKKKKKKRRRNGR